MNLANINEEIEKTLIKLTQHLPKKYKEKSEIERTENLFRAIEETFQNTEDPQILAELRQLLERTGQKAIRQDSRLYEVFSECMRNTEKNYPVPGLIPYFPPG